MKNNETIEQLIDTEGNITQLALRISRVLNERVRFLMQVRKMLGEDPNQSAQYEELVEIGLRELEKRYEIGEFRAKLLAKGFQD
jgi:plasmid maintenance system antidote protein VapI